jgi:Zn-dependent M32 family carboxypeptidase
MDLLAQVTGQDLDPRPLIEHLWGKYGELYGLDRRTP